MKYVFQFLLFVSIGISCRKICNYPHLNELQNYLTNELGYSFQSKETILIILPIDACNACLRNTITLLIESERVLDVIVCGSEKQDIIKNQLTQALSEESRIFFDLSGRCRMYELGASVPLIFHFKSGKCLYFSETTENKHNKIKEYFDWGRVAESP